MNLEKLTKRKEESKVYIDVMLYFFFLLTLTFEITIVFV